MKYKELKNRLNSQTLMTTNELDLALELVERATPKKVRYNANGCHLPLEYCISCNHQFQLMSGLITKHQYCPQCGQAIDWSDNDDEI